MCLIVYRRAFPPEYNHAGARTTQSAQFWQAPFSYWGHPAGAKVPSRLGEPAGVARGVGSFPDDASGTPLGGARSKSRFKIVSSAE